MQAGFYRGKVALFIDPEINLDWRFFGVILSVSPLPKTSSFAGKGLANSQALAGIMQNRSSFAASPRRS